MTFSLTQELSFLVQLFLFPVFCVNNIEINLNLANRHSASLNVLFPILLHTIKMGKDG